MLSLLIKTRLKYYRNYIRYHFDRTTIIEIALIFLALALMLVRSPADIGYNFRWMSDEDIPQKWANFFSIYLIIFYVLSEAFVFYTLRLSKEWQILGSLPFSGDSITSYYLFRHLSKITILILIGCLPFLLAFSSNWGLRTLRFFGSLGILLLLQLTTFYQAYRLRNSKQHLGISIIRWFLVEVVILAIILINASWLRSEFSKQLNFRFMLLLLPWIALPFLWIAIHETFVLREMRKKLISGRISFTTGSIIKYSSHTKGFFRTFIINDILFLWRQKRSSYVVPILNLAIASMICVTENDEHAIYISLLFLEVFFSLFLISSMLALFNRDVEAVELLRSLPITATSFWLARWLLLVGIIFMPLLIPIIIILIKFGLSLKFIIFLVSSILVIPGIIATIFCNSCLGMFPHINLSGYIIVVSVILMVLFWFFMPFGTLILLVVMIFWIRKSQRNFQYLEV